MQRSILFLLSCALTAAHAAAQTPPRLAHSAPWLGHDLILTLSEAPPFAAVRMLESDAAAQTATRTGRLELDLATMRVVGLGTTDSDGRFEFAVPIPLDPALAETEVHYQAFVVDPSATGGPLYSEAAHLRRLGPRLYACSNGRPTSASSGPVPGAVLVFSAVDRELVAAVDLGVPSSWGATGTQEASRPVFTWNVSRGALLRGDELVLFDPFFGAELGRLPAPDLTPKLVLSADGVTAVALEPNVDHHGDPAGPARLHLFDLEVGVEIGALELPRSSTGNWEWNRERDEIYVAEVANDAAGPKYVRRIRLQGMEDLGAIRVGGEGPYLVGGLASAETSLFVPTTNGRGCQAGTGIGLLQRIDYAFDPPRVQTLQVDHDFFSLVPLFELGVLVDTETTLCFYPNLRFWVRDLRNLAAGTWYNVPSELADGWPSDTAWDRDTGKVWFCWPSSIDGGHALVLFDPATGAKDHFSFQGGPSQVEIVHDALVHVGAINTWTYTPSPPTYEYQVRFVDPHSGQMVPVAIPFWCESLLGVGIP